MLKISQKQVATRWDSLPYELREAIASEQNADIVWKVCRQQHLPEDKILKVATLVGDILFGFIHAEDLAQEIKEELEINSEIVNIIALEINKKILFPFKKELEKIYQPPSSEFGESEELKPILDLRKKIEESSFKIVEDENQKQENKIDLSKEIKKEEIVMPQAESVVKETAPVVGEIAPVIEKIEEPARGGSVLGGKEEEKIEEFGVESAPISFETSAPAPAASPGPQKENGPLIIHEEVGFKPLSGKFKSLGGMFNFLRGGEGFKKEEGPVKANLEIGEEPKIEEFKIEEPKIEIKPESAEQEIKIVNYSEEPELESPEVATVQVASAEPGNKIDLSMDKKLESTPENLPAAGEKIKEEISEIKPEEIKFKQEGENIKPETEQEKNIDEMIDLGLFK